MFMSTTIRARQRIGVALLSTWLLAHTAQADGDATPEELIKSMSSALTTLNYEGSFVHVRGGHVEAMSIVHSTDAKGELEYMLSLNGEAREVYRNRSLVTCIWPNSKSVIVSDSKSRKVLPTIDASLANGETYDLSLAEPDRVAGRNTQVINIKPRDNMRYGYKIWIDDENQMLLRSMLVDQDDNAIEQVMFTTISYPDMIDPARFDMSGKTPAAYSKKVPESKALAATKNRVDFEALPKGYEEISETYQPMPINDGPISHVMLSDGMASVSVYVEFIPQAEQAKVPVGVSSMGAMNAYIYSLPNALITVVGEVPPKTVEHIAMAVRLVE